MKCRVCDRESSAYATASMLGKYEITYFLCPSCEFVQTEAPYWLDEAYRSPINPTDTGIIQRNIFLTKLTSILVDAFFDRKGRFLDYAGGYGIFVRMMRDAGLDCYWADPCCENLFARGFEFDGSGDDVELVTAFECFEHFVSPVEETEKILDICQSLFFSTDLRPTVRTLPQDWWYFGLEHGQHVSLYRHRTLQVMADRFGLNLYSNRKNVHFMTPMTPDEKTVKKLFRAKNIDRSFRKVASKLKSRTFSDMTDLCERGDLE